MISVIIPCYNCEVSIKRSIESVLDQTFRDYELLLIDNGSSDGTRRILERYSKKYPGVISLHNESSKGGAYARNKGLLNASGKWLQFLDADDELLSYKLAHQYALAEDSDADVIIGDYIYKIQEGATCHEFVHHANKNPWKGLIFSELGKTSSILWKRSTLLKVGGWNVEQPSSQEYELLFRVLKSGAYLEYDEAALTVIHHGVNSVSKSSEPERMAGILQNRIALRMKIRDYLASIGYLNKELDQLIDTYIYHELKINYRKVPDFAGQFLKKNRLDVPVRDKLKIESYILKKQIRQLLKSAFLLPAFRSSYE